MEFTLDAVEVRVLGSLIEKEITTSEYYPLSLNALINACNQKSSRDPLMQLDEINVQQALSRLEDFGLAGRVHESRVVKFEHHTRQRLDLRRPEIALLCLLLLRGPQTAGELRNRSDRLYSFQDIASLQTVLERMSRANSESDPEASGKPRPALVFLLPRRPGEKESRYAHLLSGEPIFSTAIREPAADQPGRLQRLEGEVAELSAALDAVMARLERLEGAGPRSES